MGEVKRYELRWQLYATSLPTGHTKFQATGFLLNRVNIM